MKAVFVLVAVCFVQSNAWTTPSPMYQCRTNADCLQGQCCMLSPIVRKRQFLIDPFYGHTCESMKNESSQFCMVRSQYSPIARHYTMSCPCEPGLRCQEHDPLDHRYGRRSHWKRVQEDLFPKRPSPYDSRKPMVSNSTYDHLNLRSLCESGPWARFHKAIEGYDECKCNDIPRDFGCH